MAGLSTEYAASSTKVFYSAALITENSASKAETAATDTARVKNVTSIGDISNSRNVETYPIYGEDYARSLPGQADPGTVDITMAWIPTDAIHQIFTADDGKVIHTFILQTTAGEEVTYETFDGRISDASKTGTGDGPRTLSVTVARVGGSGLFHK